MAGFDGVGGAPGTAVRNVRAVADRGQGAADAADAEDQAIGLLPGVVNDLPEVAPHEWIYLMS